MPADEEVVRQAAAHRGAPMVLAINKVDDRRAGAGAVEFERLAVSPALSIAAEHGLGVGDLLDAVWSRACPDAAGAPRHRSRRRTATNVEIARSASRSSAGPTVGKSSLVNRLVREDRVLVSDRAGTTRDAVDTVVGWHGRRIRLVDTAGLRRPGRVAEAGAVEAVSVRPRQARACAGRRGGAARRRDRGGDAPGRGDRGRSRTRPAAACSSRPTSGIWVKDRGQGLLEDVRCRLAPRPAVRGLRSNPARFRAYRTAGVAGHRAGRGRRRGPGRRTSGPGSSTA